jgi:hypothetical protein
MDFEGILVLDEGPGRTAALVAWLQSMFDDQETTPVVVGGAAVELYTGGAFTTGDIDLVGAVTPGAARALKKAGFERQGCHWILEAAQIFVEFPGEALDPGEVASWLEFEGHRLRVISVEDLLVDRLGAWENWQSAVDGVNALFLWTIQKDRIDVARLERQVTRAGWQKAWSSLIRFVEKWAPGEPPPEEVEKWADSGP